MLTGDRQLAGDVTVRRLRSDEAELLRDVRLAALADSPDSFGETLRDAQAADWHARAVDGAALADRAVFVAVVSAVPVGMVFVKCGSLPEPAFLGAMWVRPEFRRRGVGASLVQRALDFLRATGQTELSLWVTRGHDGVVDFYQGLGFQRTGATSALRPDADTVIDELRRRVEAVPPSDPSEAAGQ